ncbi:bifunctional diaminohydroxyphosphoribosylaminopyrimidine deaminase/5-amino-6-(5-phosphoribosylamino)uracil reductase RibD [Peteryoungia desertarenae]|uniref:Riboflavin biosynthesis protein RibD n=2 Tax=Peteryoungia desertarenae TaxID=1813451 RepID=A0ABX6QT59_9HYPH|nr:bifunctional diaminohydroxyphosphoribosylaminopyrimidine deaminase/5-amino-6-(5-phosphoribosylamino)uracil reductase RibD [Peteryoungia desertarenae]
MREAIALSLTHLGLTSTNPSVGCVIVRDGVVVGRGVTALGGRPHAEPQAIAEAGELARGATAYVTLEPCSHYGRTPPCANTIVAAGLARVVIAVADPDERVSGRGLKILADAGIEVTIGVCHAEARRALAGYLTRQTKNRPHVTVKMAVSKDRMIGLAGRGQIAITGSSAREAVHRLRAASDAILVGVGTAIADDPELTVRLPGLEDRSPIRIVLDRRLELPLTSKLARTAREVPVIAVSQAGATGNGSLLESMGVEILETDNLSQLLKILAERGVSTLMVEGGARVVSSFLAAKLVDAIHLYTGPGEIGSSGIPAPFTARTVPHDFVHLRSETLDRDRLDIYELPFIG